MNDQIKERNNTADLEMLEDQPAQLPISMVSELTRAEIMQQEARADMKPRSPAKAARNIMSLATMSERAAQECGYALPRGNKPVLGPSIRLAEIVAGQWGNARVGARVVHVDRIEKFVEAEGIFHDLETNVATTARVRRRIVDKNGRLFNDDMIIVTGNAAASIAKRNAILAAVPKAVWADAYEASIQVLRGDAKTLPERRSDLFKAFASFGVKPEQIAAYLQIADANDLTLDHIATLTVIFKALKAGEEQVETYFEPVKVVGKEDGKKADGKKPQTLEDVAKQSGAPKEQSSKPADTVKDNAEGDEQGQPEADGGGDGQTADQQDDKAEDNAASAGAQDAAAPSDADIEAAYQAGIKAYGRGQRRDAAPAKYKAHPTTEAAWQRGWDTGADEG